jgi:uncharacterized protein YcbK (DUF882 family)
MCPCGCKKVKPIDAKLTFLLQSLREKINKAIYISKGGGLRCKAFNKKIHGYTYSPHLAGKAVDISAKHMKIIDLALEAESVGFSRIGLYPYNHFIHLDTVRPYRSASWVRDKKFKYTYFKTLEQAICFVESIT